MQMKGQQVPIDNVVTKLKLSVEDEIHLSFYVFFITYNLVIGVSPTSFPYFPTISSLTELLAGHVCLEAQPL